MKKPTSRAKGIILVAFLVFVLVFGGLVYRKYHITQVVEPPRQEEQVVDTRVVTLFFAAPDGAGLVREGRELAVEDTVEDMVESVVDELVVGPLGSLAPTLPHNARVLRVQLEGEVARVDFSRELVEGLPSGSSAEMTAVYSVVDTVAANFPQVKGVQFLVDGVPVKELKGHLDLSAPVAPDFSLEKKEGEGEAAPQEKEKPGGKGKGAK